MNSPPNVVQPAQSAKCICQLSFGFGKFPSVTFRCSHCCQNFLTLFNFIYFALHCHKLKSINY
ncbi:hypothetical protein Bpfe_001172 [Biomphalaria pfeifferi]|uniref:Uncharacterized protein n=1 Tax=Biomphalaria pfeifferi TaxID=112525 RepID=A0AAD8FMR9_BIOPF|nr:hypothetical protein Bpfe_001172 [Biomphalaria pfeifferi]